MNKPMRPPLTVENAEIKTASITISTLTVSGRQVTLAVFRQLREERLIEQDGRLNGIPWGTINYHPDGCAGHRPHVHVVWQLGNELRRSQIYTNPKHGLYEDRSLFVFSDLPEIGAWYVREALRDDNAQLQGRLAGYKDEWKLTLPEVGPKELRFAFRFAVPLAAAAALELIPARNEQRHFNSHARPYGGALYAWAQKNFGKGKISYDQCDVPTIYSGLVQEIESGCSDESALARARSKLASLEVQEIARREGYLKSLASLESLPQLFIAV
jgi:hypothetical protein